MVLMNKSILLDSRPIGKPTLNNFKITSEDIPTAHAGQLLLKTLYVSVDPYLRGRMNDAKSYTSSFEIGRPIQSTLIAEVLESNNPEFKNGKFVTGFLSWKEYQVSGGKELKILDSDRSNLSTHLGILGMTGLTAYFGLTEIGVPKKGETIVISGAAGAVGNVVGQLGKISGCKVVGITGSNEKAYTLKSKFKFDNAINYKTVFNLREAIKNACPEGIDIYFDNVGGDISDAVLSSINKYARIVICGGISLSNETKSPVGPRIQPILLSKSGTMRGFLVSDYSEKFPAAIHQLSAWLKDGVLSNSETIVNGFENIPHAFLDLFEGKNEGKMIVKI